MEADYSTALTLLLRYPSPGRPHGPSTFVDDALYLRDNLTVTGGIEMISKYSGKPPAPLGPESRSSTPRQRPSHSKKPSISTPKKLSSRIRAPLASPARFIQQQGGLEALLQDAARGFYDRGEKWGSTKLCVMLWMRLRETFKVYSNLQELFLPEEPLRLHHSGFLMKEGSSKRQKQRKPYQQKCNVYRKETERWQI